MRTEPVGIIAGAGRFPFIVAREAAQRGHTVVAVGLSGWVDPALAGEVGAFEAIPVGSLGTLLAFFESHGVRRAVMAGKVTKSVLFEQQSEFDPEMLAVLHSAKDFSVNGLLGAVGMRLKSAGIELMDSSAFMQPYLCPAGVLTKRQPDARERMDIALGRDVARALADLDVGQTVIVREGVVVAVEALEGTDAAIRRAGTLAPEGLVIVKTASPRQDRRFDLPCVGTDTLAAMRQAKARCLALQAGSALLLDRDAFLAQADAQGAAVIGLEPSEGGS